MCFNMTIPFAIATGSFIMYVIGVGTVIFS
nr:MAG TPA: hypothetical protein [Caudoviricetes sp.]